MRRRDLLIGACALPVLFTAQNVFARSVVHRLCVYPGTGKALASDNPPFVCFWSTSISSFFYGSGAYSFSPCFKKGSRYDC